jgi:hypothetical protein
LISAGHQDKFHYHCHAEEGEELLWLIKSFSASMTFQTHLPTPKRFSHKLQFLSHFSTSLQIFFVRTMTKKLLGAQRQSVWIVCSRELKFERDWNA